MVVIDVGKRELDRVHFSLPFAIQATTPDEVGTVVQTRYTVREVGRYDEDRRAVQLSCTVTMFDRTTGILIGEASFVGPAPPKSVSRVHHGDIDSGPPTDEIVKYVQQLR